MIIKPVILCGGSATRLWPVSRSCLPKPFVPLFDGRTTFEMTLQRVSDKSLFDTPLIIANNEHRFLIGDAINRLQIEAEIILEPEPRDSAAAVAVASVFANRNNPDSTVVILASDHVVRDVQGFQNSIREGSKIASEGYVTTFGIAPSEPSSAFGYIQPASDKKIGEKGYGVARFAEKPDQDTAKSYIEAGYLWNSGNLIFSSETMISEMEKYCPDVLDAARRSIDKAKTDLDFLRLDQGSFIESPKISIDYALMEKTKSAAVVQAEFDWSDVGTWDSIWNLSEKDEHGNSSNQSAYFLEGKNNYVHGDDRLICLIGCENLMVVSTKDALLVVERDKVSDVKKLVETLRKDGIKEIHENLRMYRPWGDYESLDTGSRHQVKRITVKPQGKLSLQKHFHRAEHWIVVTGTAQVTRDEDVFLLYENESVYLPLGCTHRLENPGKIPLELIEVQTGGYFGEDDIVRLEDEFGRA